MTSQNSPLRSPCSPRVARLLSRQPAMLMSWQGNPAVMTSTTHKLWAPHWRTSSNWRAWGNRSASTARLTGLSTWKSYELQRRKEVSSLELLKITGHPQFKK